MEYLDKKEIRKILNLKGSDLIQPVIAERQLEVIRRGFNLLHQPENQALYIADEVGLGKTYIALGIASLIRHFSNNPETYQDVILVPKENLQNKWSKEISQFISNNYNLEDNRVRSIIGNPVGSINLKNNLEPIDRDTPGYHIYRNSSMSFGLSYNSTKCLKDALISRLDDSKSIELLHAAEKLDYFRAHNKSLLKKFYAYLLSINNPQIELLIVDEGHNYKYGLGDNDIDEVSDRNNVATRFFGLKRNSDDDKMIFKDFPELRKLIKPKVEKLIILSATPKTYSLLEIKKQLDCFLPKHILSDSKTEKDVEDKLNLFLIRGKMEYELGGKFYSRNQCRFEHRKGNVEKRQDAPGLRILDNEQSLVIGLLQYNTIKHLNAKHNATFELGMLAGFETFKLDNQKKKVEEQEFEETRTRKIRKSQDEEVLSAIINSYHAEFGTYPPHPKQDAIVEAAFEQMKNGQKSLIFVRRVASAYELEQRLLNRWEKEVIYKELNEKWKNAMESDELNALLSTYKVHMENRIVNEKLENIFNEVISRLMAQPKIYQLLDINGTAFTTDNLRTGLYYVYSHYSGLVNGEIFFNFLLKQVALDNYKVEFLGCCYDLLKETRLEWSKILNNIEENPYEDDEDESYYFHNYFRQPNNKYFRKSRIYQTDWFDMNYFLLNEHFKIATFNLEPLKKVNIHAKTKDASDVKEVQEIFLKNMREEEYQQQNIFLEEYPSVLVSKRTLITELLINIFDKEFIGFLKRLNDKSKRKIEIIQEIKTLLTIIKSTIRNGLGFLPLYIADNAKTGDIVTNYSRIITDRSSCFSLIVEEIRTIINDYELLQAVNFPDKDNQRDIENKLTFQSPVKGMSGIKKNKGKVAAQFRMPGYPYILITTEIFREGEDLHTYCQDIYHYGIAWNCSDMEQRTGRIDRINSLSNRKMVIKQNNDFYERVHVFTPYLEKTLEVNQVSKLFTSLNHFTKAFDIVDSIDEDGTASISTAVEEMPVKLDIYMKSKYEHDNFIGYIDNGQELKTNSMIGTSKEHIIKKLNHIRVCIAESGNFYYEPDLLFEEFKIVGDYNLEKRNNRRGPFRIILRNDVIPGQFLVEVSGYLFKSSAKIQKQVKDLKTSEALNYDIIDIDDYHAIAKVFSLNNLNVDILVSTLLEVVDIADQIEENKTGYDTVVFG